MSGIKPFDWINHGASQGSSSFFVTFLLREQACSFSGPFSCSHNEVLILIEGFLSFYFVWKNEI